ncbi:MAG: hypothetical protein ABI867_02750 [Kofleriaceae bacterium]
MALAACGHPPPPKPPASGPALVVLPAESAVFPAAAKQTTEMLARARVAGLADPQVSKVSLEVAQLSIECVEATPHCYEAVGRSLSASQLLFAQIEKGRWEHQVRVTVTLFDVDHKEQKRTATKLFPTEQDATFGIEGIVAEATKP